MLCPIGAGSSKTRAPCRCDPCSPGVLLLDGEEGSMPATRLRRWKTVAFSILCFCAVSAPVGATAQELYGSLTGTVQDGTGARIPGATIAIVNRDTNLTLRATSNETGTYTFTNVLPGMYDVKVTIQGFKEFVKQQVPVATGSISRVDAKLEVGQLTETVTVQSETQLLKTDKADTGSAFSSKEVVDLPLPEFRNYQSLLDLVPGSTPSEFQNAEIDTPARALSTTINGTNRNNNSTRVDGATNQFTWLPHHTLYVAPAETIASVNVTTGSFSADQGLAGGAAVTVITKSGTNRLQGSAFGFFTNQDLRAQTYFAKRNNTPKLPTDHHIDGGTLGGPIKKNRLFYFGAFEGQYRNTAGESIYTVPTQKMRNGDFSEALNANGSLQLIYDPRTGDIDGRGRQSFSGNIIPADRIDPIARRINDFYPLPNGPGTSSNYFKEYISTFDRNQYDVKVNWNRSPTHQVWGKIGVMDATVSNLQKLSFDGGGLGKTNARSARESPDRQSRGRSDARRHRTRRAVLRPGGVEERDRTALRQHRPQPVPGPGVLDPEHVRVPDVPVERSGQAAVPRGRVQPREPAAVVEPGEQCHQRQLHAHHEHARRSDHRGRGAVREVWRESRVLNGQFDQRDGRA